MGETIRGYKIPKVETDVEADVKIHEQYLQQIEDSLATGTELKMTDTDVYHLLTLSKRNGIPLTDTEKFVIGEERIERILEEEKQVKQRREEKEKSCKKKASKKGGS